MKTVSGERQTFRYLHGLTILPTAELSLPRSYHIGRRSFYLQPGTAQRHSTAMPGGCTTSVPEQLAVRCSFGILYRRVDCDIRSTQACCLAKQSSMNDNGHGFKEMTLLLDQTGTGSGVELGGFQKKQVSRKSEQREGMTPF